MDDELIGEIVKEKLSRPECKKGFLLDGYPRTARQAEIVSCCVRYICVKDGEYSKARQKPSSVSRIFCVCVHRFWEEIGVCVCVCVCVDGALYH